MSQLSLQVNNYEKKIFAYKFNEFKWFNEFLKSTIQTDYQNAIA